MPKAFPPNDRSIRHLCLLTRHKVIARSTSVRDETVKGSLGIENHPVRTRGPARVRVVAGQDGELVPRSRGGEGEALVVVVLVRVAT